MQLQQCILLACLLPALAYANSEENNNSGEDDGDRSIIVPWVKCPRNIQNQLLRVPGRCTVFIHCSNHIAYLKKCPPGLHWNNRLKVCDWPENAGCVRSGDSDEDGGDSRAAESHVVRRSADEAEKNKDSDEEDNGGNSGGDEGDSKAIVLPWVKCPKDINKQLLRVPGRCTVFIHCSNHIAYLKKCPSGLHWNNRLKVCDWPENAGCVRSGDSDEDGGDSRAAESHVVRRSADEAEKNKDSDEEDNGGNSGGNEGDSKAIVLPWVKCPKDINKQLLRVPGRCTVFIHCSNHIAYLKKCPSGLHWNNRLKVCDWPENAGCVRSGDSDEDGGDSRAAESHVVRRSADEAEKNKDSDEEDNGGNSGGDEGDSKAIVLPWVKCPKDINKQLLRVPGRCTVFIHCSNHIAYLKKCPSGLHWNNRLKVCDWPENAGCVRSGDSDEDGGDSRAAESHVVRRSADEAEKNKDSDEEDNGGNSGGDEGDSKAIVLPWVKCPKDINKQLLRVPGRCTVFIHCSNHIAYLKKCPSGLHWNNRLKVCDWPENAGCVRSGDSDEDGGDSRAAETPVETKISS